MATQASDTSSKTRARGSSDELAVIAQRAQAFTNASGTAIALSEGSADEITCRARSGATAPEVGTPMRVEGSFTGLCIHSGKELRCDDAETDTRVDTTALRSLGIRSLVVTPIKEENRVVGVLMVFAPTAHAFTITHVAVLKTMADQISALLQRERKAKEEGVVPEPSRASAPAPVAVPKPVSSGPVLAAPVVIKSSAPAAAAARTAAFPVVSKVEAIKTAPVAEDLGLPSAAVKKEERRSEAKIEHRASLGTLDALASQGKKAKNNMMMGVAAAVVVVAAAAGTFAYRSLHKKAAPPVVAQQPVPDASNPAAAGQPAGVAPGAPAGNTTTNATVANTTAATIPPVAPNRPSVNTAAAEARKTERTSPASPPPAKPSPTAVALTAGTSKIASSVVDAASPDVTPILSAPTTSTTGTLTSLTRPVASSTPSMVTQSDLEPLQVLKRVQPVYPAIAKARRLSGTVTVQGVVGKDGKVTNLQFISGPPVFRDAAFEAVKQWLFKPARLNGQPIEQPTQIRVNFGGGQ